jgi:hypothetical protein
MTATPTSAADWCHYFILYGTQFPDYPKLGDSNDLFVFGTNVFASNATGAPYLRSDILAFTKPPSGPGCPTLGFADRLDVRNADGSPAASPVPANDVEGNSSNYVVAARSGSGVFISVFQVVNYGGTILFLGPRTMGVPFYSAPANAPQPGGADLNTLDDRLTQAVEALDPNQGSGSLSVWTQHTVFGGAGAEVRWYEINPAPSSPFPYQSGSQSSGSVFTFNAAIAPDRRVLGFDRRYGDSMTLGFNTSSPTQPVDVEGVSKIGGNAQSAPVVIHQSNGPLNDGSCGSGVCRWGDYSAATPDPASDTSQSHGVVWLTQPFALDNHLWGTWNWSARPK